MHIKKLTAAVAGLAIAAGAVACNSDNITKLNTDPNNPTSAPPGPVFTQAIRNSAAAFVGNGFSLRQTEFLDQHWAEVQYPDEDRYARLNAASTQGAFNNAYSVVPSNGGQLINLKKLVDQGLAEKNPAIYGPAQIMMVWNYDYLTDTWGDIPYSQALKADSGVNTPQYDAQKDIYASFFAILNQVSAVLDTATAAGYASADPMYGGNLAAWQKFANSLHARLAMRIINVDPTTAATELAKAFSAPGGVFQSNDDMAQLAWPGDGIYDNPIDDNFSSRDDHRVSNTFYNILSANNDPREPVFMQPTIAYQQGKSTQEYAGMPNGLDAATASTYFSISSRPGTIFWPGATPEGTIGSASNKKNPSYLMTYAELALIQAEAKERGLGNLPGSAASYYDAGITASMNQWGITDQSMIDAYLAQPSVAYQGGTAGLKQIALQKYIALTTDGAQTWAEERRTCIPAISPGPAAVVNYVPRRFYYPTTEYSLNATNLAAAVARQGPDNFATHVWWDVPANAPTCGGGSQE